MGSLWSVFLKVFVLAMTFAAVATPLLLWVAGKPVNAAQLGLAMALTAVVYWAVVGLVTVAMPWIERDL